jgi:hypothetical protein
MTFCLESIIIKPEEGVEIKNAYFASWLWRRCERYKYA